MRGQASAHPAYTAEAVLSPEGKLVDVRLNVGGRVWHLLGRGGEETELRPVRAWLDAGAAGIPVFLGAGTGAGVEHALARRGGPVVVVDKEDAITGLTGARDRLQGREGVLWLDAAEPAAVLAAVTRLQMRAGGRPFAPLGHPLYLRLDPGFYREIAAKLDASRGFDFWARARYPRFQSWPPRVLLLSSLYFLMGEMRAACERTGVPHRFVDIGGKERGTTEFVEELLTAVIEFKPDFVLTINHLGVDREGVLADLLARLELPLVSWFVDNPHLILYFYKNLDSPLTAIFTWDRDNIASLKERGFRHVEYLPLATDATRFQPPARPLPRGPFTSDVTFVGNSMLTKVAGRLRAARLPAPLLRSYKRVAADFGGSEARDVGEHLREHEPEAWRVLQEIPELERRLAYEALLTWEATRRYRTACVEKILPFNPLIVGDRQWKIALRESPLPWRWHPEVRYYDDLPVLYPQAKVNFNCTSKQMKGAVNQRIFDVPACGAFVLTDWREQMDDLFEPGKEVVCYRDPQEIPELLERWLRDETGRARVAAAARRRILAEHTYDIRLGELLAAVRRIFG